MLGSRMYKRGGGIFCKWLITKAGPPVITGCNSGRLALFLSYCVVIFTTYILTHFLGDFPSRIGLKIVWKWFKNVLILIRRPTLYTLNSIKFPFKNIRELNEFSRWVYFVKTLKITPSFDHYRENIENFPISLNNYMKPSNQKWHFF